MKKISKNIVSFLFVTCMLIANCYVPIPQVKAKTIAGLKEELAKYEEDYKNNQLEKEMTENEKKKILDNINQINTNIETISNDIISLNEQIAELNEKIKEDEEEIASILAFTQVQNGESAYLEYAFGAQDFTDFIYRIAVSEQLTTYNNELIEKNKQNIADNKKKTEELQAKKIELGNRQNDLRKELEKVKVTISEIDDDATTIQSEIANRKAAIASLEKMGCREDEEEDACMMRYLENDTSFHRPISPGYVSGWVGMRYHPIWHENRMHYGTDISISGADRGNTPVYAVASGEVVIAIDNYYDNNNCGGKKVYIVHNINGKVYTSGYWHLNTIYVKAGQKVNANTKIGVIAGRPDPTYGNVDRCSNGGHVHLELSTGTWAKGDYSSKRFDARQVMSFPSMTSTYVYWYNR